MHQPRTLKLKKNGWVPNNERLPVLVYIEAIPEGTAEKTRLFKEMLKRNGWPAQWQNGIYNSTITIPQLMRFLPAHQEAQM